MGNFIDTLHFSLKSVEDRSLPRAIVNEPFKQRAEMVMMGIGIIVLLIADEVDGNIHRVALSRTEMAEGTLRYTSKKFEDIKIPLGYSKNIIAQAIASAEPQMTEDWHYLFAPALSANQARLNQAGGSIACSYVYPLKFGGYSGALIFSYYKQPTAIGKLERQFMGDYSQLVSGVLEAAECAPDMLIRHK